MLNLILRGNQFKADSDNTYGLDCPNTVGAFVKRDCLRGGGYRFDNDGIAIHDSGLYSDGLRLDNDRLGSGNNFNGRYICAGVLKVFAIGGSLDSGRDIDGANILSRGVNSFNGCGVGFGIIDLRGEFLFGSVFGLMKCFSLFDLHISEKRLALVVEVSGNDFAQPQPTIEGIGGDSRRLDNFFLSQKFFHDDYPFHDALQGVFFFFKGIRFFQTAG